MVTFANLGSVRLPSLKFVGLRVRKIMIWRIQCVSCLSTTVSQLFEPQLQKIVIFTYPGLHFLFALGTPLWQSCKSLHGWKDNSVLAKPLAACTYLCSIISELYVTMLIQCVSPKIAIFTTFCFPWKRPWGNHAKCYMDGKRIRCLQIVSLHVPI